VLTSVIPLRWRFPMRRGGGAVGRGGAAWVFAGDGPLEWLFPSHPRVSPAWRGRARARHRRNGAGAPLCRRYPLAPCTVPVPVPVGAAQRHRRRNVRPLVRGLRRRRSHGRENGRPLTRLPRSTSRSAPGRVRCPSRLLSEMGLRCETRAPLNRIRPLHMLRLLRRSEGPCPPNRRGRCGLPVGSVAFFNYSITVHS
jgi:hypothetical protein